MLEDDTIKHLITWTPSNVSFVISPGEEFSKVLAQYFKHTNPSSFVRQLNMYGFHKVNDTFHSNSSNTPDTAQWEFKHGAGSFKRGDVESLKAIKRRASRPSTIHRDNISLKSVSLSVPSTPPADYGTPPPSSSTATNQMVSSPGPSQPPLQPSYLPQHHSIPYYPPPDNYLESRIASLEHSLWTLRSSNSMLLSKYNNLVEACKLSHTQSIHLVDTISKLADPAKKEGSNSSIVFELSQIRNTLQMHQNNLSHLVIDDQHLSLTQQRPSLPLQQQQQPLQQQHNYSFSHPPATKSEISFASSARERAASIFYDPLAPAPNPTSPRHHLDDPAAPAAAPPPVSRTSSYILHPHAVAKASPENSTPSSPVPTSSVSFQHPFQPPPPQPQSPVAPPTSAPQQTYFGEPPTSPSGAMPSSSRAIPPTRDQRPGSFPFISSYHSQRQQSYMGGPLIPSSNPYGHPSSATTAPNTQTHATASATTSPAAGSMLGLNSTGKLRTEAMAPYRRHTSSELLINKPPSSSVVSPLAHPVSISSPPASSSRHNSYASSNSSAASTALANPAAPTLPPLGSGPESPKPTRSGSTVQSLLNPTAQDTDEPDRKRLKV